MNPAVSGIILAGGRSRRLGVDKRLLRLGSSRTQLAETISRISDVAGYPLPGRMLSVALDLGGPAAASRSEDLP